MSNSKFYGSAVWKKLRANTIAEHGKVCQAHLHVGQMVVADRYDVDHIIPINQGGHKFHSENRWVLCVDCHNLKRGLESHRKVMQVTPYSGTFGSYIPEDREPLLELMAAYIRYNQYQYDGRTTEEISTAKGTRKRSLQRGNGFRKRGMGSEGTDDTGSPEDDEKEEGA